jgi:hypothetical protein
MSRVFSEEDAIMRAQQIELIYSQSGILYEIFLDVPWSILDNTRQRLGPHADGIFFWFNTNKARGTTDKTIATIVYTAHNVHPHHRSGCSPYPNVGCTQCEIDKFKGHPIA